MENFSLFEFTLNNWNWVWIFIIARYIRGGRS